MEKGEMEEIKRHFGVVAEGLRIEIQQVAEGVANVDEKLDRFRQEVKEEFKEVKAMIKFSYSELDHRLTSKVKNEKVNYITLFSYFFLFHF